MIYFYFQNTYVINLPKSGSFLWPKSGAIVYPQSYSFSLYPELVSTGQGRNVDQPVLYVQLSPRHSRQVPSLSVSCSTKNKTPTQKLLDLGQRLIPDLEWSLCASLDDHRLYGPRSPASHAVDNQSSASWRSTSDKGKRIISSAKC